MTAVDVDALDKLREALVTASTAVGDMAEDWWCPKREGVRRTECRYCIAEFAADALLPVVDRIANERAAAMLREAASDVDDGEFSDRWSAAARQALLARADQLDEP